MSTTSSPLGSPPRAAEYVRAALTGKMLALAVFFLTAAVVCVQLSIWQFDRAALRGADEAEQEHQDRIAAAPAALGDVLEGGERFTAEDQSRTVTATGTFDPAQQILVPDREVRGEPAVLVVTAMYLSDGENAGAMMPVMRGWLPPDELTDDGEPVSNAAEQALQAPAGELTVAGHLVASEASPSTDLELPWRGYVSTGDLANLWGGPSFSGYITQSEYDGQAWADASPWDSSAAVLGQMPPPEMGFDTGINIQNIAYAVEWLIFGAFALYLWVRILRDNVKERREEEFLLGLDDEDFAARAKIPTA